MKGDDGELDSGIEQCFDKTDTTLYSFTFSKSYWPVIVIIIRILFKGILHQNYMPNRFPLLVCPRVKSVHHNEMDGKSLDWVLCASKSSTCTHTF